MKITKFLNSLQSIPSTPTLENQYLDPNKVKNLEIYLREAIQHKHSLFVGEAAGYLGMAQTGIGFTSPYQLDGNTHFFLDGIVDKMIVQKLYGKGENSARYFWESMTANNIVPVAWNACPFHPHKTGDMATNDKPTKQQIAIGKNYLLDLLDLISPQEIVSIGSFAYELLNDCGIPHKHARHPSYGGSNIFKENIDEIFGNKDKE